MLILQRKVGESLVIGDDITISVVSVDGPRVRLSISAPGHIPILRSELVKAAAANQDSAMANQSLTGLMDVLDEVLIQPHSSATQNHYRKDDDT